MPGSSSTAWAASANRAWQRVWPTVVDLALAVVFGRYDALSVAEAIKDACPEAAPASMPHVMAARCPGALEGVLRQVLEGPVPRWVSGSHSYWSSTTSNVFWMSHSG